VWWYKHVASGIQLWENLFRPKKNQNRPRFRKLSRPVPGQADDDGWKEGAAAATAAAEEPQKQYGGGKIGENLFRPKKIETGQDSGSPQGRFPARPMMTGGRKAPLQRQLPLYNLKSNMVVAK
jgi:hypothetical protein